MMVSHGKSCHFHCDQWLFFLRIPPICKLDGVYDPTIEIELPDISG